MIDRRKYLAGFFVVFIIVLFLWGVIVQWDKISMILSFIFYGIVFAYLLVPISRWIEKFMSRSWAVILLFLGIIIILTVFLLLFVPTLIKQLSALSERLPSLASRMKSIIERLQILMDQIGLPYSIVVAMNEFVEGVEKRIITSLKKGIDGVLDGAGRIAGIFTVPVLSFYFIKDREYFKKVILAMIPSRAKGSVLQVASQVNKILSQFIRGQLLTALVVGTLTTIGYWIIELPYAMVLGLVAGIFEIIPYFGPFLGAIPAVIIAILNSPSKLVWTIIIAIIAQQLEGNIFTPKIMGDHVGLHPVYIIIVLWIGNFFFGILGMLFAVPAVLILRIILKNIYISIVSTPWSSSEK